MQVKEVMRENAQNFQILLAYRIFPIENWAIFNIFAPVISYILISKWAIFTKTDHYIYNIKRTKNTLIFVYF